MSLKCYYHPEREAQSKCEKCGKLICLECKKAFNITHGASKGSYSTRHEYCQVCYFNHMSLSVYKTSRICFITIIINIIFLVVTNVISDSVEGYNNPIPFFLIPFLIVLSIAFIFSIIHGAKKREKIRDQKNGFLLNLKKSSRKKGVKIPICKKCGKQVDLNALICPYCGCDIIR